MADSNMTRQVLVAARAKYANYTLTMVTIGFHIFMALYGVLSYLDMPKSRRKGRTVYVVLSFLMTLINALAASVDMYRLFKCLLEATGPFGYLQTSLKYAWGWERHVSIACLSFIVIIGDGLLIYRCFIIWERRWLAIALPTLTYFACGGVAIATIIPLLNPGAKLPSYQVASNRESAWVMLNVITNVIVTAMIAFKLLSNRRELAEVMPDRDLRMYSGVVEMLIESVAPLSLFGVVYAAVSLAKKHMSFDDGEVVYNVFSMFYYSLCGLAPHLIIFRVMTNKTWAHKTQVQLSTEDSMHPIKPPTSATSIALSPFSPRRQPDSHDFDRSKIHSEGLQHSTLSLSVECKV